MASRRNGYRTARAGAVTHKVLSHKRRHLDPNEWETIRTTTRVGSNQKVYMFLTTHRSSPPPGNDLPAAHPSSFVRC